MDWKGAIILNRIRTPDGKVLTSYNRHDHKTYLDLNGYEYMVDGGTDYLRRGLSKDAPEPEELSEFYSDDHEANAKAMHWGGFGIHGDQPRHYRPIRDLTCDHIRAILSTQLLSPHYKETFQRELLARLLEETPDEI